MNDTYCCNEIHQKISQYKNNHAEFQHLVCEPVQFSDHLLFQICQYNYKQSSKEEQEAIEIAFWELISRYQQYIYNICYRLCKVKQHSFHDPNVDNFYVYVEESLITKLQNDHFFLNFIPSDNFKESFSKTLCLYITRFFWKGFQRDLASKECEDIEDIKEPESLPYINEKDPNIELEAFLSIHIPSKPNKKDLFSFFLEFPTRPVRKATTDEKVHNTISDGQEKNRSLEATKQILEDACQENQERSLQTSKKQEEKLSRFFWGKRVPHFKKFKKIQHDVTTGSKRPENLEKAQNHYNILADQHRELLENISKEEQNFQQLSYPTLAKILNTSEDYCYKLRCNLKEDWQKIFKEWYYARLSD